MGLRAFVALPLEQGGTVLRPLLEYDGDAEETRLITELAYGLSSKQTLLFGLPYRVTGDDGDRTGDASVFYRYQTWSSDARSGTTRMSLLGGAVIGDDGRVRAQAGAVVTWFHERDEVDVDVLGVAGDDREAASGRYDLSWQHRLDSGGAAWWMSVLELGGRWREDAGVTHQATLGLQRISARWVLEGGLVRDLDDARSTSALLGLRVHF